MAGNRSWVGLVVLLEILNAERLIDLYADALADAHQLTSLWLWCFNSSAVEYYLRASGGLAHLRALRTLTLVIHTSIWPDDKHVWQRVDATLSSLELDAVTVMTEDKAGALRSQPPDALTIVKWMPGLLQKGILHVRLKGVPAFTPAMAQISHPQQQQTHVARPPRIPPTRSAISRPAWR